MDRILPFVCLIRPKDWVKNLFLFVPLFFTPDLMSVDALLQVLIGFILFSAMASCIYILNDLKDCVADRLHPIKRHRPIASSKVSPRAAVCFAIALGVLSGAGGLYFSLDFFWVLLGYFLLNVAYTYQLKQVAILDIYCIAAGFILRVVAGAVIVHVTLSIWITICVGLLALFLALAKRRDDLVHKRHKAHRESMQGYSISFIDTSMAIVLSALMTVYILYATFPKTSTHLETPHFYWTIPVVLLGILRYLQLTFVEKRSGSPTAVSLTDPFLILVVLGWITLSAYLIYW